MEDLELYHPFTGGGSRVRLHDARPEDLANHWSLVVIRGEVMLKGRTLRHWRRT